MFKVRFSLGCNYGDGDVLFSHRDDEIPFVPETDMKFSFPPDHDSFFTVESVVWCVGLNEFYVELCLEYGEFKSREDAVGFCTIRSFVLDE